MEAPYIKPLSGVWGRSFVGVVVVFGVGLGFLCLVCGVFAQRVYAKCVFYVFSVVCIYLSFFLNWLGCGFDFLVFLFVSSLGCFGVGRVSF